VSASENRYAHATHREYTPILAHEFDLCGWLRSPRKRWRWLAWSMSESVLAEANINGRELHAARERPWAVASSDSRAFRQTGSALASVEDSLGRGRRHDGGKPASKAGGCLSCTDPIDARCAAGNRWRRRLRVTDYDRSRRQRFCRQAECFLAVRRLQPGLSKADPACAKLSGPGRQHEILCCEGAILDRPWPSGLRRDHDQCRCMIEDVKIGIAQTFLEPVWNQVCCGRQHVGLGVARYPIEQPPRPCNDRGSTRDRDRAQRCRH